MAVLGFRPSVKSPLAWLSDGELLLSAGPRTLARFDQESRTQTLLHASPEAVAITAVAVSPSRAQVAVAEFHHDGGAIVVVHELEEGGGAPGSPGAAGSGAPRRRRRALAGLDLGGGGPVTCLSFTPDGRHLLVAGAPPDVTLSYVARATGRLVATARGVTGAGPGCIPTPLPLTQVDACPQAAHQFAVSGAGTLRQYRFYPGKDEEKLQPHVMDLHGEAPPSWTCHAWMSEDRIIAGTAGGRYGFLKGG